MRTISHGGARSKPGRFTRRWIRFWVRMNGVSPAGRVASRLAALFAPPHLGQVKLAHMFPRGYIDSSAAIYHSSLFMGRNVYLAPGVQVFENTDGGPITLEDKVAVYRDVILETGQSGSIQIGSGSSIHPGCQLKAYMEPVVIGEGVMIAGNVALYSYDHGMAPELPIRKQLLTSRGAIIVKNEAWIGTGCVILSGVTIGEGAIVGGGSTVTKDIPAGGIAVGNPARVIRYRHD